MIYRASALPETYTDFFKANDQNTNVGGVLMYDCSKNGTDEHNSYIWYNASTWDQLYDVYQSNDSEDKEELSVSDFLYSVHMNTLELAMKNSIIDENFIHSKHDFNTWRERITSTFLDDFDKIFYQEMLDEE